MSAFHVFEIVQIIPNRAIGHIFSEKSSSVHDNAVSLDKMSSKFSFTAF